MSTHDIDGPSRAAEIDAIGRLVAAVEHAQNNERPDEFLALFRDDAIWTTGGGKRLYGLDEIATFTRQVLPGGMQGMTVTFEMEHVLFIRPDIAAVKLVQRYRTPDGTDTGTPLWVMAKEGGQWRLVACQNGAAPADEVDSASGARPVFAPATE